MIKQVLVLRKDLNMRKGKMIAQGAHASLLAFERAIYTTDDFRKWANEWRETGTTKIVVSVSSLEEFNALWEAAEKLDTAIPKYKVLDAGHTEFKEPTYTAIGLGPAPAELIDTLTGTLPLL
jgi:PTH2 family peptidyl-tRNA hydrolase